MRRLLWLAACASIGLSGQEGGGEIQLERMEKSRQLRLLKDARFAEGALRLTPPKKYQTGAAWATKAVAVSGGFETTFTFRLTEPARNEYGGADGFAFVIQTMGVDAIAGRGAAGGFSLGRGPNNPRKKGIPRSLAIFFDTFQNEEEEDVSGNSVGVFTNGDGVWLPRRLALNADLPVSLEDGEVHTVRIEYVRPRLSVFLDDIQEAVLKTDVDIASITGSDGDAYVGFTAATGEGYQYHDILSWKFRSGAALVSSSIQFDGEACLPDRTLCTPAKAEIKELGAGKYSVVLPAHLEWGASIASAGVPKFSRMGGTACWDREAKGNQACNGPEGNAKHATEGLLRPDAPAGALIWERRGERVFFSVNGKRGEFEKNEGYFDFEVTLGTGN